MAVVRLPLAFYDANVLSLSAYCDNRWYKFCAEHTLIILRTRLEPRWYVICCACKSRNIVLSLHTGDELGNPRRWETTAARREKFLEEEWGCWSMSSLPQVRAPASSPLAENARSSADVSLPLRHTPRRPTSPPTSTGIQTETPQSAVPVSHIASCLSLLHCRVDLTRLHLPGFGQSDPSSAHRRAPACSCTVLNSQPRSAPRGPLTSPEEYLQAPRLSLSSERAGRPEAECAWPPKDCAELSLLQLRYSGLTSLVRDPFAAF
ncbi:uncharacterized protein PHACADRAFT_186156 [Phanerochaete carnosa HHB-10118-sp]|uniref:Uncharacterized protein n=1 Tax=Phanerochaete carnosa (strain HHB-10118-sp) TaxID=650164 RepID=K5WSU7_PHACS|nr:uncharacterized protein PHACADRAFT_186156 [Phanerochaete carnosa HHB-10118-sp]EKM53492.1 hypothetical protein PHACADRAFT_186156 [Phanerochaete carnosa HHB-10118-sp]